MNLLSTSSLAQKCDVTTKTVRRWHHEGRLGPEPVTLNGQMRFSLAEVEAWIAAGMPRRQLWTEMWRARTAAAAMRAVS